MDNELCSANRTTFEWKQEMLELSSIRLLTIDFWASRASRWVIIFGSAYKWLDNALSSICRLSSELKSDHPISMHARVPIVIVFFGKLRRSSSEQAGEITTLPTYKVEWSPYGKSEQVGVSLNNIINGLCSKKEMQVEKLFDVSISFSEHWQRSRIQLYNTVNEISLQKLYIKINFDFL